MGPSERAMEQAVRNLRTGIALMVTSLPKAVGATKKEVKMGIAAALAQVMGELLSQVKDEK